ncbi:MAG: hypothetical protein J6J11_10185 [Treponema sp.]|nr:hypothetical protein [Treponema sp.]
MSSKNFSLIRLVLQIAVGAMLAVGGIWALQGGGDFGANAIRDVFNGDIEKILVIVFGVVELLAGIFLIIELFVGDFGKLDNILMLIILIVWIVAIVLSDFLGGNGLFNGGAKNFLAWLYDFANHLIVLGALLVCRK